VVDRRPGPWREVAFSNWQARLTSPLQRRRRGPDGQGKLATHAIVWARLIIAGKDYGIHAFMVQIRYGASLPKFGDLVHAHAQTQTIP